MTQGIKERWRRWFGANTDKKLRVLLLLGLLGIALIALSEWLPSREASGGAADGKTVSVAQVEEALEQRISALIGRVAGVGDCRVLVTLESGSRFVYAAEQSQSGSASSEKTLLVETDAGPVGLLITEVQPSVKGVAVVCGGGDDPTVREQVTGLICAAFNISSGRVGVAKLQ